MNDFQQAFRNELFYPDILPFEEDLFDSLSDKLYYLKRTLEEIDQNAHLEGSSLLRSIVKIDISRLNYLLTEYLKELPTYQSRLSQTEINFLQDYYQMANKLIIQTGELEDFIAKKQKLFDYPIVPQNSGAFFLLNEEGKLSITKSIEPEQLASILQKQSQLK